MTLNEMENILLDLQKKVIANEDRGKIENLMGRYQYLHTALRDEDILETLWSENDDITFEESANGVYCKDRGGIAGYYRKKYGSLKEPVPGRLEMCAITTPVIEVAADGKTAKGVWTGFGHESSVYPDGTMSGIPSVDNSQPDENGKRTMAHWVWQKYGADFIKEGDVWKILHLHIYDVFRCPYGKDWIAYSAERFEDDEARDSLLRLGMERLTSERPTSFHWQYSPEAIPVLEPRPPVPYQTLSDTFIY